MKVIFSSLIISSIIVLSSGEHQSQDLEYVLNKFVHVNCPLADPIKWYINGLFVSNHTRSRFTILANGTLRVAAVMGTDVVECRNYNEAGNITDRFIFHPKHKKCSRRFCNDHGECKIESSPFNVNQARCFCDPGFRGEFCEEVLPTRFFLVIIFWIVVLMEISSLIIAVIRHQIQTTFRLRNLNALNLRDPTHFKSQNLFNFRFVDVLNGALDEVPS